MFGLEGADKFLESLGIHIELYRYLIVGGLIFMRIFIMAMFLPYLGARPIPGRVRIAVSVALLLLFYPPVSSAATTPLPDSGAVIFSLFLKEVLFAVIMGLSASMVFYGMQAAGNMIDNQRMLANAMIFNPAIGAQATLFGNFYYHFSVVVFLVIGGHHWVFKALARSFEAVPVLGFPKVEPLINPIVDIFLKISAEVLVMAVQISAPAVVAIFIADIILGLMNRVAPMINVFEMGFNLKGYIGVVMVYFGLPLVFYHMKETLFPRFMLALNQLVELFVR